MRYTEANGKALMRYEQRLGWADNGAQNQVMSLQANKNPEDRVSSRLLTSFAERPWRGLFCSWRKAVYVQRTGQSHLVNEHELLNFAELHVRVTL